LVAEGIETPAELRTLLSMGCDYGQGFLLGRPAPEPIHGTLDVVGGVAMGLAAAAPDPATRDADSVLAFYAGVIRQSPVPSYIVDRKRRLVAWNQAATAILGYTEGDLDGLSCPGSPMDHRSRAGHRLCMGACPLVTSMARRTTCRDVVAARHRDGSRVVLDVWVIPLWDPGTHRVVGAIEHFRPLEAWPDASADGPS
jgi:PAS domain S-box-containing protein